MKSPKVPRVRPCRHASQYLQKMQQAASGFYWILVELASIRALNSRLEIDLTGMPEVDTRLAQFKASEVANRKASSRGTI